jgi:hypothetical protein
MRGPSSVEVNKQSISKKMDQIHHKFIDVRGLKLHLAEIGTGH